MWEPTDIPSPCPSSFTAHNGFHRQTVSTSHLYQHPWLHWICLTHKSAPWHGQLTTKAYPLPTYPTAKSMSRKLHPILMCPVFLFLGVTLIFWLSVQQWCEAFFVRFPSVDSRFGHSMKTCPSKSVTRQP